MQNLRRALGLHLTIYSLYLLVAVVMTWPLVTQMGTHFAGYPFGDAHEMTRHIWWFKYALQTGQPLIFQPLLGYPEGMQGVILWSDPLQFFPAWFFAFFMPLPAAYNLFVLLTLALNGWAAYWLVWRLTGVRAAGVLGGLAFMTAPIIQGHLAGGHGGLVVQWPLPLLAWTLLEVTSQELLERPHPSPPRSNREGINTITRDFLETTPLQVESQQVTGDSQQSKSVLFLSHSTRYFLLATLFFFLTAMGHTLQLIYAVLPLVVMIGVKVVGKPHPPAPSPCTERGSQAEVESGGETGRTHRSSPTRSLSFKTEKNHLVGSQNEGEQEPHPPTPTSATFAGSVRRKPYTERGSKVKQNVGGWWWAHGGAPLLRLVAVCVVGTGLLVVFLLPVFSSTFGTSAYTAEGGGVAFSADLLGIVSPSFNHPLYGQWEYTHRVLGVNIVEGSVYVGIIAGLLALVGAWQVRAARWWLAVAVVAWVLALGPVLKVFDQPVTVNLGGYDTYVTLPYALVYNLPGFSLARTPGRFGFLLALAVAVLVGYGWAWVVSRQSTVNSQQSKPSPSVPLPQGEGRNTVDSRQSAVGSQQSGARPHPNPHQLPSQAHSADSRSNREGTNTISQLVGGRRQAKFMLAAAVVGLLIMFDYQAFWPLPTYSAVIPQAVYVVAGREDVRAVFDVPWDNLLAAKDALWLQTAHEKPIIAGQVTRRTPVSPAKLTILEQTLSPALLREAGADVVVVHKQYDAEGKLLAAAGQTLGAPTFEDEQVALFDVPDAAAPIEGIQIAQPATRTTDQHTLYIYTRQPGWLNVILNHHDAPPAFSVSVDGQVVREWEANAFAYEMPLAVPLATAGYHIISTDTQVRCPEQLPSTVVCAQAAPTMSYEVPSEWVFDAATFDAPITFERGVVLAGHHLQVDAERLGIDLWWQFEEARGEQDIRFVKVLDAAGKQVAGDDHTLGTRAAGSAWVETLALGLPDDLPTGEYRVLVGWYTYPDLTRFGVLTDVEGAADGLALVGTFTIGSPPQ